MSVNALTGDMPTMPQGADQRAHERVRTVLINAGVSTGGRDAICRIRNHSAGGILIETGLPLAEGMAVTIQLRSGRAMAGEVRWVEDRSAGIALAPEDAQAVLDDPAAPVEQGAFPRFARAATVHLAVANRRRAAPLVAISPHDVEVACGDFAASVARLSRGDMPTVIVTVDGLDPHQARIARIDGDRVILALVEPFQFRALEAWLEGMPA
jgi:hypothetical protein